jgi:hypothetical protein
MSMTLVRPFIRGRMNALGFREWADGFNTSNIPSTLLDKSYHIQSNNFVTIGLNQHSQDLNMQVILRVFRKGFRDVASGIDTSINDSETIIKDLLAPSVRIGTAGFKNIVFNNLGLEPIESNDNIIIASLDLNFLIVLGV